MGTEHVAPLLYSLAGLLRPSSVLEVGGGYTTLFLAQALADAAAEAAQDAELLTSGCVTERTRLLSVRAKAPYHPVLVVLDDLTHPKSRAGAVPETLKKLGLDQRVTLIQTGFAGASQQMLSTACPFDLIWFDCGAAGANGSQFLYEYWPLLNDNGGVLVLHSMYTPLRTLETGSTPVMVPSAILNELSKRQADEGRGRTFELLSLIEPHKTAQGDLTIIRRIGPLARIRGGHSTEGYTENPRVDVDRRKLL